MMRGWDDDALKMPESIAEAMTMRDRECENWPTTPIRRRDKFSPGDRALITRTGTPVVIEQIVSSFFLQVRVDVPAADHLREPYKIVSPIELARR